MKFRKFLVVLGIITAGAAVMARLWAIGGRASHDYIAGSFFADWGIWTAILGGALLFVWIGHLIQELFPPRSR